VHVATVGFVNSKWLLDVAGAWAIGLRVYRRNRTKLKDSPFREHSGQPDRAEGLPGGFSGTSSRDLFVARQKRRWVLTGFDNRR
jgi:hypothetical protein